MDNYLIAAYIFTFLILLFMFTKAAMDFYREYKINRNINYKINPKINYGNKTDINPASCLVKNNPENQSITANSADDKESEK